MHSTISYKHLPRDEADATAIADIREYLSPKQWTALTELAAQVEAHKEPFGAMQFAFMITGVQGFPFNAFCRKHCKQAYITYMRSGDDPVEVDEDGFTLTKGETT